MKTILQKLLNDNILTEDVKNELIEAFEAQKNEAITEAVEVAKAEATAQVKVELTEQWLDERDALVEAIDQKLTDQITEEIKELTMDIESFRDLEAEYATRLVEERAKLREQLESDLDQLVDHLDEFLDIRLSEEMSELREDIEEVKKLEVGRKIFEAFVDEYKTNFVKPGTIEAELKATQAKLQEASREVNKMKKALNEQSRASKINELTKSLNANQKEIMESVLRRVPTDQLDEGYEAFIGKILTKQPNSKEKENTSVLAEQQNSTTQTGKQHKVINGDVEPTASERFNESAANSEVDAELLRLRRLAGIID